MDTINSEESEQNIVYKVKKNYNLRRILTALLIAPAVFVAAVIVTVPFAVYNPTLATQLVPALIVTALAEIMVIFWAASYSGLTKGFLEKIYLKNFKFKHILYGLLLGQAAYWGLQLVALIFSALGSPLVSSDTSAGLGATTGLIKIFALFFFVPIVAPLLEEILFRGVVISTLKESTWSAPWIAVLISAVSFGVMHIQGFNNVSDFVILGWIMLMGAVFAATLLKTKSLWVTIVAHGSYNLMSSIALATGVGS